jgi:hypothetical protein
VVICLRSPTGLYPGIDFREFEFPEASKAMSRQPPVLNPAVDRVSGNSKMPGDLSD